MFGFEAITLAIIAAVTLIAFFVRGLSGFGSSMVGVASGVLNGAAGIGGSPAIVFFFASSAVAVGRATVIAFFLLTNTYLLLIAGAAGVLPEVGWQLIAVALRTTD